MTRSAALLLALAALAGSPREAVAYSSIKVDFAEAPEPQQVTGEGFCDWVGTATFGDVILLYPREMPLVRQYRPADEVLSQAAIDSLKGQPVVNDHPTDEHGERITVTPENAKLFVCGTVLDAWREGNRLRVRIRVFDRQLLDDIRAGKIELSLGYRCATIPGLGTTSSGETYDAVQRGHRYNHVAFVGRGRAQGARITTDAQDDSMDDIAALIASGKFTLDEINKLLALLQAERAKLGAAPEPEMDGAGGKSPKQDAPAAVGAGPAPDLEKRLAALEAAVAELRKGMKADGSDDQVKHLADKVATAAALTLRNLAHARALATPILGGTKADSLDDVGALHRDVVATVWPEMKGTVEDHYKQGRHDVLQNLAEAARAQHNRRVTADAADYIHRAQGTPPTGDLAAAEKALADAMTPKPS